MLRIELYKEILHVLGFGLCHQLPERSFIYGGVQFPVCARCTGIYVGIIVTLIILFVLYRGAQRTGVPGIPFFIGAAIAVGAMGFDGFASYLGYYETTNFVRVLTGIMFGSGMAPVIYSLLVESLAKHRSTDRILNSARDVMYWILSIPLGLAVVYGLSLILGFLAAGFQGLLIITTFWLIALVLVGLVPRYMHSVESWRDLKAPLLWALPIGCAIILLCAGLQLWAMGVLQ